MQGPSQDFQAHFETRKRSNKPSAQLALELTAVTPAMLIALGGGDLQAATRSLAQMSAFSAAVEFV